MKLIQLKIKALSPLAIGRRKPGGSISEAETYIPGSVLRGAIAGQILRQAAVSDNEDLSSNGGDFQALFLSEEAAIFQNAYPMGEETETEIRVLPATALSSKTSEGFRPKGIGVFDTVIDRYCAEAHGSLYDPDSPNEKDGRVEPYKGFYSYQEDRYTRCESNRKLLTRVGINRRRSTAEDEILYSLEVLSEAQGKEQRPSLFQGAILIGDEYLAKSLAQFLTNNPLRLGGAGSRGLGRVEIQAEIKDLTLGISKRVVDFNQKLDDRWKDWSIFTVEDERQTSSPKGSDRTWFTLDLQSDAILREDWRRTMVISEKMLQEFTEVQDETLKLESAYSSYDYRSGWNAAWGLMKDIELVTNIGGVYLFSTNHWDRWETALEKLELSGVGDRCTEGFGQIRICDEFHLILREDAV